MRYPIAIEPGDASHAYGVMVPDLPGCFSAGDTLDEAIDNTKEAIELCLEDVLDNNGDIPEPRTITEHQANPNFAGWVWAVVSIDLAELSDKAERINITLPARVLRRIDRAAKEAGESRSGYIAKRALMESRCSDQDLIPSRPAHQHPYGGTPMKKITASDTVDS